VPVIFDRQPVGTPGGKEDSPDVVKASGAGRGEHSQGIEDAFTAHDAVADVPLFEQDDLHAPARGGNGSVKSSRSGADYGQCRRRRGLSLPASLLHEPDMSPYPPPMGGERDEYCLPSRPEG